MATSQEQRDALVNDIVTIAKAAEAEGRDLTDAELTTIEAKDAEITVLNERIKRAEKGADIGARLAGLGHGGSSTGTKTGDLRYRNTKAFPVMASKITETLAKSPILGLTEVPEPTDLYAGQPQQEFGEVGTIQGLIGSRQITGREFAWVQEAGGYAPKAAVWTPESGLPKPETSTTFTRKKGELAILAVMSQPIQVYDAQDAPELVSALSERALWDLTFAETALVLDGSAAHGFTGLRNSSGTLVQAFVEDEVVTVRRAIGALESTGVTPNAVILNPEQWTSIELTRDADGNYVVPDGVADRAARKLWGLTVIVSTQVAVGEAFVLNTDAVSMVRNGGVAIEATNSYGEDLAYNRLRVRYEQRAGVAVTKPGHIVKVSLTATP